VRSALPGHGRRRRRDEGSTRGHHGRSHRTTAYAILLDIGALLALLASSGKKVIAGGVQFVSVAPGSASQMGVQESRPVTGADPEGCWSGILTATYSDDWKARVYAVCATVTP
jgi:hypothetical protein